MHVRLEVCALKCLGRHNRGLWRSHRPPAADPAPDRTRWASVGQQQAVYGQVQQDMWRWL